MAIEVDPKEPRTFIFTNKRASFYSAMTSGSNRDSNQGFNVFGRRVLADYSIDVDGVPLDRSAVTSVRVSPTSVSRTYPGGFREAVTILDEVDVLVVTVESDRPLDVSFTAWLSGPSSPDAYSIHRSSDRVEVTPHEGGDLEQRTPRTVIATVVGSQARVEDAQAGEEGFAPARLEAARTTRARFAVIVGSDLAAARVQTLRVHSDLDAAVARRRARLNALVHDTYVTTGDARFDRALAWLKISGDALVTDQASRGIWAGLYWFNNYWGRDTFISLPGICLVTGRYDDAREILLAFARYQDVDPKSPLFGRVPNRVNSPTDVIYNTADGTPWFVREAYEYVRYSGDRGFVREIFPAIARATDGTMQQRTDPSGLLVHEDADTWMDAKWEGRIPWSPRGDRAVDVQALWIAQLEASSRLAAMVGDHRSESRWRAEARRVRESFRRHFVDGSSKTLFDHIDVDGSPDRQMRPNQLFALTVPFEELLPVEVRAAVVRAVAERLTFPYGVASLSQDDANFHPYHHDERWHFDSAYHNGTVWIWNTGPMVSALTRFGRQDLAFELTRSLVDQTLDRGSVGTLSELLDAIPRDEFPELSGTETQAWSIAEFVRNFYQDYLGVSPDVLDRRLTLAPRPPRALGTVRAVIPFGRDRIKMTITPGRTGRSRCSLWASRLAAPIEIVVPAGRLETERRLRLVAGRVLEFDVETASRDAKRLDGVALASPRLRPDLRVLAGGQGPAYRAVAREAVVPETADARTLYEASDPPGDDTGPAGTYTYPLDTHYEPGILDLLGARVSADEDRYYVTLRFRRLADPGWHPELGFQLTYVAIAIDFDSVPGSGVTTVGKSSGYELPPELAYERIVYVGGGLEVQDRDGRVLMTYSPSKQSGALGDARRGSIAFSIPRTILGSLPANARFAFLVGGQDDGGSAGLGVFRRVGRTASQWSGGGAAVDDGAPAVYDALLPED